jgi:condensin complex subunit 1
VDSIIKTNILVALGDLIHRYPNVIERFMVKIFDCLKDRDANVRKTTLLVLTHLILNDMLKVKNEIAELAILLDDSDLKVSNLAKLFFYELNKKDSKVLYNILPDAISRMSREEERYSE